MTQPAPADAGRQHDDHDDHDEDGYRGPATLHLEGPEGEEPRFDVDVVLRGHFEPLDGRFHWYGRVSVHADLDAALGGRKARAVVVTPHGHAVGELSDVDPWGRYRLGGTSTPPFAVGAPEAGEDVESAVASS